MDTAALPSGQGAWCSLSGISRPCRTQEIADPAQSRLHLILLTAGCSSSPGAAPREWLELGQQAQDGFREKFLPPDGAGALNRLPKAARAPGAVFGHCWGVCAWLGAGLVILVDPSQTRIFHDSKVTPPSKINITPQSRVPAKTSSPLCTASPNSS